MSKYNPFAIKYFKKEANNYTVYGALFGFCFPIGATIMQVLLYTPEFSLANIIEVQKTSPLLWIINTAPFFLGLFARFAGKRQDVLLKNSAIIEEANQNLTQEIIERKRIEEELRESEERFRLIPETMPIPVSIVRLADETILYCNARFTSLFGPCTDGTKCSIIYENSEDKKYVQNEFKKNNFVQNFEFLARKTDGSSIWMMLSARTFNFAGVPAMVVGLYDIDELKRSEEKIREQAECLDVTHDAIIITNLDDTILFWNKGAENLYGWNVDEVLGKKSKLLLYTEKQSEVLSEYYQKLQTQVEWRGELYQHDKTGKELLVEGRWTYMFNETGKPKNILFINRDITEKKKIENHLFRTQRMESLGTLAGGIAHDLNNIFTPMFLSFELIRRKIADAKVKNIVDTLETSAKRGASMVKQILVFARGGEGEKVVLTVSSIVREIGKIIKETFPQNIIVNTICPSGIWHVLGDPTQLHQIFMNLCINARDAMPNGGELHVEVENITVDQYYHSNAEITPGKYVMFIVADTGTGIPESIREKIFDPFFTTKEVGKGTGLGLATVHSIVKKYNGFIHLYSEEGKGTTFKIYIPAVNVEGEVLPTEEEQISLPKGNKELCLVVDDELPILSTVYQVLENNNYRVITARDGEEAIVQYKEHNKEISCILMDVMMPRMDGITALQKLREINPVVKIIASSGLPSNEKLVQSPDYKANAFLMKPYSSTKLLTTLHKIINE